MMNGEGKMPSCDGREESPLGPVAERSGGEVGCRQEIVWRNVILMALLHVGAVYSLFLIPKAHLFTLIWGKFCACFKEMLLYGWRLCEPSLLPGVAFCLSVPQGIRS